MIVVMKITLTREANRWDFEVIIKSENNAAEIGLNELGFGIFRRKCGVFFCCFLFAPSFIISLHRPVIKFTLAAS